MAGQIKKDREWSQRSEAIRHLAAMSSAEKQIAAKAFGLLFNSEPATLLREASGLEAAIVADMERDAARLAARIAEHKASKAAASTAPDAKVKAS